MTTRVLKGNARLFLESCKAKPNAKVGQALGPLGVNMMEICRSFNAQSEQLGYKPDVPLRVFVAAYEDRSYDLKIKGPSTSHFLFKAGKIEKGTGKAGREYVGEVDARQIYEIAKIKIKDQGMENQTLEGVCKSIASSCASIGLKVVF
jgi:large subunit ribosomal protein L11